MKFGRRLEGELKVSVWAKHYINYKYLKRLIKEFVNEKPTTDASTSDERSSSAHGGSQFALALLQSASCTNEFYLAKVKELAERCQACGHVLEDALQSEDVSQSGALQPSLMAAIDSLAQLEKELTELDSFASVNSEAIRKIIKKYRKHGKDTQHPTEPPQHVCGPPEANYLEEKLASFDISKQSEQLFELRRDVMLRSKQVQMKSALAAAYWARAMGNHARQSSDVAAEEAVSSVPPPPPVSVAELSPSAHHAARDSLRGYPHSSTRSSSRDTQQPQRTSRRSRSHVDGPDDLRPLERRTELKHRPGNVLFAYLADLWSSLMVFKASILTFDTLLAALMSTVGIVVFDTFGKHLAMQVDIRFITGAIIFPMTMAIMQAFNRRDAALRALLTCRAWTSCIYSAHMLWDWPADGQPSGGRRKLPPSHTANVRSTLESIHAAIEDYCLLPRGGHARFMHTPCGRREMRELERATNQQTLKVERGCVQLTRLTEVLKAHGFPSGEASRLHQFVQKLMCEWELVRAVKEYRTPHAMRSFARVYVIFLPFLTAPQMVDFMLDGHSTTCADPNSHHCGRFWFACVVSAVMSCVLAGLLAVALSLENPFRPSSLDSCRVSHEMRQATMALDIIEETDEADAQRQIEQSWISLHPTLAKAASPATFRRVAAESAQLQRLAKGLKRRLPIPRSTCSPAVTKPSKAKMPEWLPGLHPGEIELTEATSE